MPQYPRTPGGNCHFQTQDFPIPSSLHHPYPQDPDPSMQTEVSLHLSQLPVWLPAKLPLPCRPQTDRWPEWSLWKQWRVAWLTPGATWVVLTLCCFSIVTAPRCDKPPEPMPMENFSLRQGCPNLEGKELWPSLKPRSQPRLGTRDGKSGSTLPFPATPDASLDKATRLLPIPPKIGHRGLDC